MLKGLQTDGCFILFYQILRKLVTQIKVLYRVICQYLTTKGKVWLFSPFFTILCLFTYLHLTQL